MNEDTSIVRLRQPDAIYDPLTALLRSGARQLLEQAIEAEVAAFLASMKELKLPDGRDRLVRHGHGPERVIQTGIGPVEFQRVKVRDRDPGPAAERIRFSSALLPRWARRTTSLDALLPILYLRGVSAGDFQEALSVLLGKDAPNLSPAVISRLKESCQRRMKFRQLGRSKMPQFGRAVLSRLGDRNSCLWAGDCGAVGKTAKVRAV